MSETLADACRRVQADYLQAAPEELEAANAARLEVFALAIRRHVPYRALAELVGIGLGNLHHLLRNHDTSRGDALKEPR